MSYILDALKKSDRERQQENLSPLQQLYEPPPSSRATGILPGSGWPWFLLCGFLALGGLLTIFGLYRWIGGNPPAEMAVQQSPDGQTAPSPADDAESGRSPGLLTVRAELFDEWFQHRLKKDSSLTPEKNQQSGELDGEERSPVAAITATGSKEIAKPINLKRDREKIVKVVPQPDPAAVVGEPQSLPPVQPQFVPPEKSRSGLPYLQDLSPQVRADIPKLDFAGHAYALEPSQRLIVVNGAIMREGDQIDAATRLAEITWEGVIIERKGLQFQVKCY